MTEEGKDFYNQTPKNPDKATAKPVFHQTTPERAKQILKDGFKRETAIGAGSFGPLRGIFLKETPDLLEGAGIGKTQLEVVLDPTLRILDLSNEQPPSFYEGPIESGYQDTALGGWIERQNSPQLTRAYQEAIRNMYQGNSDPLNKVWPEVEAFVKEKGYGAVKYIDHFVDTRRENRPFTAIVVFDASKIKPKI